MSKFVIYINLPKYKAEWLTHCLGDPVVFPDSSPQNAIIRTYLQRLPKGYTPDCGGEGMTAIAIPSSKAKPPEYYNYMGPCGKAAVAETIDDLFRRSLWTAITPLREQAVPCGLNKMIAAWCEANGIGIDRAEAVRQCYYRMRNDYAERGINLKKKSGKI